MHFSSLIKASLLALAAAQNVSYSPLSLGYFSYPHGNAFIAWSPFVPTKTSDIQDICDTAGAIKGTATWTAVRFYNTYAVDPICRKPFNYTSDETGERFYNVELACVDDDIEWTRRPEVTAVVEVATNKTIQTCVPVVFPEGELTYSGCSPFSAQGVSYNFACNPV
ncbi:hypothetical protein CTRI78_v010881 [Colletotrichum trifolii]|uniref:Uncharacterized protein n=1 Tax=Colletotrichum trifolii TaxID=5466 RepID=A0A4R8QHD9_COLTR|nr:hypothetical protein CTRI78_v010881 [Colletotrichum trifolii]